MLELGFSAGGMIGSGGQAHQEASDNRHDQDGKEFLPDTVFV